MTDLQKNTVLLTFSLLIFVHACGRPDKKEPPIFLSTAGLAVRTKSVPPQKHIYVLDRHKSRVVGLTASGVTSTIYELYPPPGTWPQTLIPIWQNAVDTLTFVVPASDVASSTNVAYRLATLDLQSGSQSTWQDIAKPATAYVVDDEIIFSASNILTSAAGQLTLPADAHVLPSQLLSDGFVYLTTQATLAWWQPRLGTALWSWPVSNTATSLVYANGYVAWVEAGYALSASASANGIANILRAPIQAAVAAMGFDTTQPTTLWLALADGTLTRLKPSNDKQRLCYVDNFSDSSTIGTQQFVDVGRISNPTLKVLRYDLPGCPGWTLSDKWYLEYEGLPPLWNSLSLANASSINQIPSGHLLQPGFVFNPYRGGQYNLASTQPLSWTPTAPDDATGILQPIGVWLYHSERRGAVALAPSGQAVTAGGLVLTVNEGLDKSDRGDRFGFISVSGVDSFEVGYNAQGLRLPTVFGPWEFFSNHAMLVLDRKSGRVTIINAARSPFSENIKRVQ